MRDRQEYEKKAFRVVVELDLYTSGEERGAEILSEMSAADRRYALGNARVVRDEED